MHMDGAEQFTPELTGLTHAQLHTKPGEMGDTSRLCCGPHWNSVLSGCFILRKSREVKLHSSLLGSHLKTSIEKAEKQETDLVPHMHAVHWSLQPTEHHNEERQLPPTLQHPLFLQYSLSVNP